MIERIAWVASSPRVAPSELDHDRLAKAEVVKAVTADRKANSAAQKANPMRSFGGACTLGREIRNGLKRYPVSGATASVEGENRSRVSATRVGVGFLVAGSTGAQIAGMVQKDLSKVYVSVETSEGIFVVEGPAKMRKAA